MPAMGDSPITHHPERQRRDAENRLTGVSGSVTASYVYDGDGNRVKETIAGVTRVFVGNHCEVDNGVVKKYYYAGATRVAENNGGALTYLLGDHLGSQALTLDSSGNRLNTNTEIRYYAYGVMRYTAGSTPTSFNFTGQRRDSGSGLLFYNARWYDPAVGRFLSADTIVPEPGNPAGLNRYLYSLGNPLRYTDPSGHYAFEEDPSDQWVYFDPSVRSKYYFTHPEYKQRQLSDTEILGTLLAVPAVALVGGVAIGAAASATGVGADILTSAVTGACADGDCTNEVRGVGQILQSATQTGQRTIVWLENQLPRVQHIMAEKHAWDRLVNLSGNLQQDYQTLQPYLSQVVQTGERSIMEGGGVQYRALINGQEVIVRGRELADGVFQIADAFVKTVSR